MVPFRLFPLDAFEFQGICNVTESFGSGFLQRKEQRSWYCRKIKDYGNNFVCVNIIKCWWCPIRMDYREKLLRNDRSCVYFCLLFSIEQVVRNSVVGCSPTHALLCSPISALVQRIFRSEPFHHIENVVYRLKRCSDACRAFYKLFKTPDTVLVGLLSRFDGGSDWKLHNGLLTILLQTAKVRLRKEETIRAVSGVARENHKNPMKCNGCIECHKNPVWNVASWRLSTARKSLLI